ncbi:ATP-binding protein [Alkalibaculum sporogenes]|nr:ATP-binding protein [Alkalibaculum sporogenes]
MKHIMTKSVKPSIISQNNIICEVNNEFIQLSGYLKHELIGKTLTELSKMIRISSQICFEDIKKRATCYMFTKEREPREVTITFDDFNLNEKTYIISEVINSRLEDALPVVNRLMSDNENGTAIYSSNNVIILNLNQNYLNLQYGRSIKIEDFISRPIQDVYHEENGRDFTLELSKVLKDGKSIYKKEMKYQHSQRGDTYYNSSLIPVFKNGKIKLIVHSVSDVTEFVLNRILVTKQRQELNSIIQSMSDGLYLVDKDYKFTLLNRGSKEFLYEPDSIKTLKDALKNAQYFDSDGKLLEIKDTVSYKVLNGENIKNSRIKVKRPDGIFYFSVSGSSIYDENGDIEKAIICTRDITEQESREELIKVQNEKLKIIMDNMSDELMICDQNGHYTMLNKTFRKNAYLDNNELSVSLDHNEVEHFDIEGKMIPLEDFPSKRVAKGEKICGYRMDAKRGNVTIHKEVNGTPIYDSKGDFIAGIIISRDIGDRLKSEENLLKKVQGELLTRTVENLNLAYITASYPDFIITYMNSQALRNLKGINDQVSTKNVSDIIGTSYLEYFMFNRDEIDKVKNSLNDLTDKKGNAYYFFRHFIFKGKDLFIKVMFQPMYDVNKDVYQIVIISIDLTEQIVAKNELEKALITQDEIFANISHELKTPLNVIFTANQLTEYNLKNSSLEDHEKSEMHRNINLIKQNCYRFMKLINNIVDLSKLDSGFFKINLSNENIVEVIENIVESVVEYTNEKGLQILFDTDIEEKILACDPNKLERILLNLISNAIKFSNPGSEIFVGIIDKGQSVEISVKDTGVGIDEKHLSTIFERFHQIDKTLARNAEGSGIGLSLVKSIVDLHGGKISVDSQVGKGSIFKVELPVKLIDQTILLEKSEQGRDRVEMIKIEFSDIYH